MISIKKEMLMIWVYLFISILTAKSNTFMDAGLAQGDGQFMIENKGQWPDEVLYLTQMKGLNIWITKQGVNYTFYRIRENAQVTKHEGEHWLNGKFDQNENDDSLFGHRVVAEYVGANTQPTHEGKWKKEEYFNYLIGNDPSKHSAFVGLYKEAIIKEVYHGIDIRYYFDGGYLRYDYIVHPGADPAQIKLKLSGQYDAYIQDKDLVYTTQFGEVQFSELHTYQQGKTIPCWFIKHGSEWQIALGNYDKTQTLIIDPLIYSTYLGGANSDFCYDICNDADGNAYITGQSFSIDYDITPGTFQIIKANYFDVVVTKLNPSGSALVYSTFIGGNYEDRGMNIEVDGSGNVYITGYALSTTFPVTQGAFQSNNGGNEDVFVAKLNQSGSSLIYSTFLGGSSVEIGYSLFVDGNGQAYVTGITHSTNFDVTPGAFQTTLGGGVGDHDAFVTKINSTGTGLLYSTYIGDNSLEYSFDIAVDNSGCAFITGNTSSTNFPVTTGAFQQMNGGYNDVFVTKLNPMGTGLIFSTLIGGSLHDNAYCIVVDSLGQAYVTGETRSYNYPSTPGVIQPLFSGGNDFDVFITKLNALGTGLVFSTFLGDVGYDAGKGLSKDGGGNLYIAGMASYNFDITPGAFQSQTTDGSDVFVAKLNPTGSSLIYSTYIGGSQSESSEGLEIDGNGYVFIAGLAYSTDYDVTPGAFQPTFAGGLNDIFITKINPSASTGFAELTLKPHGFAVFPNPNKNHFTIQTKKDGIFELIGISGNVINSYQVLKGNYTVYEQLPAGIYIIRETESNEAIKLFIE